MQEQDGNKGFNIRERLEDLRREHEALRWEGTFRDYFELVAQNPRIAQLSHARINDMVHAANVQRLIQVSADAAIVIAVDDLVKNRSILAAIDKAVLQRDQNLKKAAARY
jgi:predicted Ser/Thr protein kinase